MKAAPANPLWQRRLPPTFPAKYIGKDYRGKGIGKNVITALVERGKALGYDHLAVGEIYDWNEGSRRCFESIGFQAYEKTEKGSSYRLNLYAG